MILVAKRVAGGDVFDSDDRSDVARVTGLDVFAFVGLNLDQTRNAFAFVRARIVNGVAFAERSGINAEENKLSDIRIAPKLERDRAKRGIVIGHGFHRLLCVGAPSFWPGACA